MWLHSNGLSSVHMQLAALLHGLAKSDDRKLGPPVWLRALKTILKKLCGIMQLVVQATQLESSFVKMRVTTNPQTECDSES